MNLFSLIPGNFFSLLSSGNREIYFDALMLLNDFLKNGLVIRVDDYIASLIALIEDRVFILEAEDKSQDMPDTAQGAGGLTAQSKARLILNRFIQTGWIDKEEMDGTFTEIITPRDYAIRVMRLLDELRDERVHEYNSLVYSTYSALKQAVQEGPWEMFNALITARRNTEQLTSELKTFYHNIRGYLKRIPVQSSVNELLESHFEQFKPLADRIYHPIKTMDSIHRYRAPVQDILAAILENEGLIAGMRERAQEVRKYKTEEEAQEEILSAIHYTMEVYENLDKTTDEIDRRYHAYVKNSIDKMTYMMAADQSVKGKVLDILKAYGKASGEARDRIGALLEVNISVNRQYFLDADSVFRKDSQTRRLNKEVLQIADRGSFADNALARLKEELKNLYSLDRIRRFVEGLFSTAVLDKAGEAVVASEEIPVEDDTDFILLIFALIRCRELEGYTVSLHGGRIERNGYRIPKMEFRKKGRKGHA
ncbi:MAG: DUF5716 family protein [Spirochaetaceae bacterium]|jgi:hypothetical protein|nr:DUF5716 family protein [Spirochaetaceae bacterium]